MRDQTQSGSIETEDPRINGRYFGNVASPNPQGQGVSHDSTRFQRTSSGISNGSSRSIPTFSKGVVDSIPGLRSMSYGQISLCRYTYQTGLSMIIVPLSSSGPITNLSDQQWPMAGSQVFQYE